MRTPLPLILCFSSLLLSGLQAYPDDDFEDFDQTAVYNTEVISPVVSDFDDDFVQLQTPGEPEQEPDPFAVVVDNRPFWQKYMLELGLASVLVMYLLNYFMGKRTTRRLALSWLVHNKPHFAQNFELLGFEGAQRQKDEAPRIHGHFLEQQSNHSYVFYATGRQNMLYCHVDLEFQKRHDLLSFLMNSILYPSSKDRVSIEIGIDYPEPVSPLCFAVVPTNSLKDLLPNLPDLKALTSQKKASWLDPAHFVLLAENEEVVAHLSLIKDPLRAYFKNYGRCLKMLHFTDQEVFSVSPRSARFDFEIPVVQREFMMREVAEAAKEIIYLLTDHMAGFHMSKGAAAASTSARSKFEKKEKEERLEQLQKKKEMKRKEELRAKEALSGAEQQKLEDKEKAKEKKKMMKKKFKVVKA